jgi:hypothetical protein
MCDNYQIISSLSCDSHFNIIKKTIELNLSLAPTIEAVKICNGSSGKQMKTDDTSWKYIGIKWKRDDNIALRLKLIELMIYEYDTVKSTGKRGSYHRSIL